MDIPTLLASKEIKPKEKTEELSRLLLANEIDINDLVAFAASAKDAAKATCIEAIEFATLQQPSISNQQTLQFVIDNLAHKAPRVKWESAKVIGNIAHCFPTRLEEAVKALLANTEHTGTVVRWSAAFALGEIVKLNTPVNDDLIPAIHTICEREEKNSIRKIYHAALKKIGK